VSAGRRNRGSMQAARFCASRKPADFRCCSRPWLAADLLDLAAEPLQLVVAARGTTRTYAPKLLRRTGDRRAAAIPTRIPQGRVVAAAAREGGREQAVMPAKPDGCHDPGLRKALGGPCVRASAATSATAIIGQRRSAARLGSEFGRGVVEWPEKELGKTDGSGAGIEARLQSRACGTRADYHRPVPS